MTDRSYEGDIEDVREIAEMQCRGPYHMIWQPALALWKKDHLIVVYGGQLEGKSDMGEMFCCVSTDDGDNRNVTKTLCKSRGKQE